MKQQKFSDELFVDAGIDLWSPRRGFLLIRLSIFTSEVVKSFEQYSCYGKDIPKICNKPWIISSLCDKAG